VPYVPHPLSFEGVRQLVRVLFKVISGRNPKLKILGFLPVMTANHVRQHRQITEQVTKQFGALRVLNGIRTDIKLAEAFGIGKPVRLYAPKSRGAEDFAELTTTLIQLMKK
jgi:chromosome partitioning protein